MRRRQLTIGTRKIYRDNGSLIITTIEVIFSRDFLKFLSLEFFVRNVEEMLKKYDINIAYGYNIHTVSTIH